MSFTLLLKEAVTVIADFRLAMAARTIWPNFVGNTLKIRLNLTSNCMKHPLHFSSNPMGQRLPNFNHNYEYWGKVSFFQPPLLKLSNPYFYQNCNYAKSRDKKKSDKGQKKKIQINEEIVADVIDVERMKTHMQEAIERLKEEYKKNLSLRSTTGSIETLPITFEGKEYILQDLAQIVRKNPKTVVVNMGSFPQVIPTVIQAINKSGMNLNPQQDGTTIFIPIPKVTKEHRESLAKNAKALFIKCRDSVKDVQNKFIKAVKNKEKDGLAKDTSTQICEYIMLIASEYVSSAEKLMESKQQELLKETQ